MLRIVPRFVGATLVFFTVHGIMAVLHEIVQCGPSADILIMFPVTKLIGDLFFTLVLRTRLHSFWEDWLIDLLRFSLLAFVTLVSLEFWRNALALDVWPNMVLVATATYLVSDLTRKGGDLRSELS